MRFLITGDLVVTKKYNVLENVDQSLIDLFGSADCNIVNLEAPVTESECKIIKTGPHIKSEPESTLNVLKSLDINIAALANNHIKDYDERGVLDTLQFCEENNVQSIGAGVNINDASFTHVINTDVGTVSIINIAENEWASAEVNTAGANGMHLIKDIRKIQEAKEKTDFVFVIVHGGHEYYSLPSPRMQEQYRFYAEQGADLVVGHHTHCVSGFEIYQNTPIYYSLGNFLFTKDSKYQEWYTGLILEVNLSKGGLDTCLHPVQQEKGSFKISLLADSEKKAVNECVQSLSEIISNKTSLVEAWNKYVFSKELTYSNYWSPKIFFNKYLAILFNKLNMSFSNVKGLSYYFNLMRCEAHHDLSQAVLKKRLEK